MKRGVVFTFAIVAIVFGGASYYLFETYESISVDPAWQIEGNKEISPDAVTVRYTGTSTLLFSDGETTWMLDGWFSRPSAFELLWGEIEPDLDAIEYGLKMNGVDQLDVVIPIHSHYDHAMDSPEVARRTDAVLLGSESTANIARGWGLSEPQIRVAQNRETFLFGKFEITLIETQHFQFPDPQMAELALANPEITEPLVPPAAVNDYRVGKAYAVHVKHPQGTWLIQGSAGFEEGALKDYPADTVFLGIGGLGTQTDEYREMYWHETVEVPDGRRIIPVHWDSLTGPIHGPFTGPSRAEALLGHDGKAELRFLREKSEDDPNLEFIVLPRYERVVLYDAPTEAP